MSNKSQRKFSCQLIVPLSWLSLPFVHNNSVIIRYHKDKSIRRIEVRFSNSLTYDSLVNIKNVLKSYDITINYKRIEFDKVTIALSLIRKVTKHFV